MRQITSKITPMENFQTKTEPSIAERELINEQPGHRFQAAERMIDFINANYRTIFECPEGRRQYLLDCNYDDFSDLLVQMNAISRGIDPARHDFDGQEAALSSGELPDWENRQPLLQQALGATKEILAQESSTSTERLGDLATLWGGTLTATHLFFNGNGRTSRILGLLIDQGFDGTPQSTWQLQVAMSQEGDDFFVNSPLAIFTIRNLLWRFLYDGLQRSTDSQVESNITASLYPEDEDAAIVSLFIETVINPESYVIDIGDLHNEYVGLWGIPDVRQLSMNDLYRHIFKNLSYLYTPLTPLDKLVAERRVSQSESAELDRELVVRSVTRRESFENAVEKGRQADLEEERATTGYASHSLRASLI